MRKRKWIGTVLGGGCALAIGLMWQTAVSSATSMGTETEMAGMSYTLDQYCSVQIGASNADPEAIVAFADSTGGNGGGAVSGGAADGETDETEEVAKKAESSSKPQTDYSNVGISIAADYVNIRKKPNTDADIVGKLYRGSAATISKEEGDWVYIKSGSVTGYINKDYLAIGYSAEKLIDDFGTKWATVTTETLRVREEPSEEADILTLIQEDENYAVVGEEEDWAKINVDDDFSGYVSKDYVKISVQFKKAVSIAEEREKERRKEAAEAAEREDHQNETSANDDNESSSSSSSSNNSNNSGNGGSSDASGGKSGNGGSSDASDGKSGNGGSSDSGGGKSGNGGSSDGGDGKSGNGGSSDGGGGKSGNGGSSDGGGGKSGNGGSSDAGGGKSGNGGSSDAGGGKSGGGKEDDDEDDGGGSTMGSGDGSAVAAYALKFVGNPYVYGGSSLTHGTDCSGFTMSVYAKFGISLPHSSSAQSGMGKKVSASSAQAGDLVFYGSGGSVSHVAICIGGGRVVHASNPKSGIKTSDMFYRSPICVRRFLS